MTTKILLAQPALKRYEWELDTAITSIRALTDMPIVLLFMDYDHSVIDHFTGRYEGLEIHSYQDRRDNSTYPATTRPWLMWQYLAEDPSREQHQYFQIDSDVAFREWPDFSRMTEPGTVYGSDCGGYIDYDYLITRQRGQQIIDGFCRVLSIDEQLIKDTPGAGAQMVYSGTPSSLWEEVYRRSNDIWYLLSPIESDIQKWTAEMWAQLYVFAKHGYKVEITDELAFCRPTDDIKMWELTKLLHNAGVVGPGVHGLLYKGKYMSSSPFDEDLSWVRRDRAGWHYARAVDRAAGKL